MKPNKSMKKTLRVTSDMENMRASVEVTSLNSGRHSIKEFDIEEIIDMIVMDMKYHLTFLD